MLHRTLFFSALLVTGCANNAQTVHVQILPTEYRAGDVRSDLATPVVDEVVRQKPKRVQLSMCLSTPPTKAIQLHVELKARLDSTMTAGYYETCPKKSVARPIPAPQAFMFTADGMLRQRTPADALE